MANENVKAMLRGLREISVTKQAAYEAKGYRKLAEMLGNEADAWQTAMDAVQAAEEIGNAKVGPMAEKALIEEEIEAIMESVFLEVLTVVEGNAAEMNLDIKSARSGAAIAHGHLLAVLTNLASHPTSKLELLQKGGE